MKFAFVLAEKALYPIAALCRALGVSRSGFHAWVRRRPSRHAREEMTIAAHVVASHERSLRTYGGARVVRDLKADGVHTSRRRVGRIMRDRGLQARPRRARAWKTTDSRHDRPIASNILGRMFRSNAPNVAWVSDVTAIPTGEGWAYLAVMIDLFSRRVVGWAMSETNDTALALQALRAAIGRRSPAPGLIHHSDRGSPYASDDYRAELKRHGCVASMSRSGDCWDNAVAESFFSTVEFEVLARTDFATREQARRTLGQYIDSFYNLRRRHSTVDYFSPIEFELRSASAGDAA